jgi:TolB-like protein
VQTGSIEDNASQFMNDAVVSFLRNHSLIKVIPLWKAAGVSSRMLSQDLRGADKRLLAQMGKDLGADAVFSGTIYRFRDRVGTAVSVTSPASVAFAVELVRVSDGKTIWSRPYDQTQRSLDENLFDLGFFLKSKGRWLTAEELASLGLKETLSSFPLKKSR